MKINSRGFTIVELVVVVVIIGILAAITIATYSGSQGRARDSQRLSDADNIVKALEIYKVRNHLYPNEQSSSWETTIAYPSTFINDLVNNGVVQRVPVDPTNSGNYQYRYYKYTAGSYGCDASRGDFYVLEILRSDVQGAAASSSSPGFSCPTRDWQPEGWWVTGDFTY